MTRNTIARAGWGAQSRLAQRESILDHVLGRFPFSRCKFSISQRFSFIKRYGRKFNSSPEDLLLV